MGKYHLGAIIKPRNDSLITKKCLNESKLAIFIVTSLVMRSTRNYFEFLTEVKPMIFPLRIERFCPVRHKSVKCDHPGECSPEKDYF